MLHFWDVGEGCVRALPQNGCHWLGFKMSWKYWLLIFGRTLKDLEIFHGIIVCMCCVTGMPEEKKRKELAV